MKTKGRAVIWWCETCIEACVELDGASEAGFYYEEVNIMDRRDFIRTCGTMAVASM